MGFTEKGNPERMTAQEPFGGAMLQGPLQKREGVRDTPRQCICVAQIRSDERRPTRNDLRDRLGTFEHGYGSGRSPFRRRTRPVARYAQRSSYGRSTASAIRVDCSAYLIASVNSPSSARDKTR